MTDKNRKKEFLLKFNKVDVNQSLQSQSCDLGCSFDFCALVKNERTGVEKRHYFDSPNNISKIVGNCEQLEREGRFDIKIYDNKGRVKSEWKKIL